MGKGFTLVELAIVLVIIGLLVGGIVAGQELIEQSKIRSQIKQFEEINRAGNSFQAKYNCIPGDCKRATMFFTSTSQPEQVTNGNGDGSIKSFCEYTPICQAGHAFALTGVENYSVFDHLAASGLYNFPQYNEGSSAGYDAGIGYPVSALKETTTGVYVTGLPKFGTITKGNKIILGACNSGAGQIFTSCGLSQHIDYILDLKLDDGLPYTGSIRMVGSTNVPLQLPTTSGDHTTSCATYASNTYRTTHTPQSCAIAVNASF